MLGLKYSVLLLAVFITYISVASSGVMVPREIPEDPPEAQEGPSGAAPEETIEPEDEEEEGNLMGRRRGWGPSFGNPHLGGNPELEDGFEAMPPPLRPNDFEVPDTIYPGITNNDDYDRRNPARGNKDRGRPFGGRRPYGGPRIPVNRGYPFGGRDDDEGPRIPIDEEGRDHPFGGRGDGERPRIPTDEKGRDRPFGGRDDDEGPRIPIDEEGRDRPFGGRGDGERPRIPTDEKGRDPPFGGRDDDEGPRIPTDEKGIDRPYGGRDDDEVSSIPTDEEKKESDEDIDNEIDKKGDDDIDNEIDNERDKDIDKDTGEGNDEATGDDAEKDAEEDTSSEEKHGEDEGKKPDSNEDEDKGSEEKDDEPSHDDEDHPSEDEVEKGIDQEEGKDTDEKTGEESDDKPLIGGSAFDTPFFNIKQITKYIDQLEKAIEHVFRDTVKETSALNGTFANTTDEEVDINGQKYIVHKSIIKSGDKSNSVMIEAISSFPESNDTKPAIEDNSRKEKVKID